MTDLTGLDTLLALRDLLQNEEKYGPVLEEMRALRDETKTDLAQINGVAAKIADDRAAVETARTETAAKHNEIHQSLLPREAEVQTAVKLIQEQRADLGRAIRLHNDQTQETCDALEKRKRFVEGREEQVKAAQKELDRRTTELDARQAELDRRDAAVKAALGG